VGVLLLFELLRGRVAGRLFQVGSAAFTLFLPVLAGFVAYSIADRPGLAPGLIGGYLAVQVDTGFLGALLAGFLAGYVPGPWPRASSCRPPWPASSPSSSCPCSRPSSWA
jgi:hypothetical protein